MDLTEIYCRELPDFLREFAALPELQRLKQVGMNCGCEYTAFPRFRDIAHYSRFDHSVGTALIVWKFTGSKAQALAALFHDIATPVFAHVVDFLNGDYLIQESTEAATGKIIAESSAICGLLERYGISPEEVSDYSRYPAADLPSPRLCADRLEYSLGNMVNFGFRSREDAARFFDDVRLLPDGNGGEELGFLTPETAEDFAEAALLCSRVYVSDEGRYSMQILSEILGDALKQGVLCPEDLYGVEPDCIAKLCRDDAFAARWEAFRRFSVIRRQEGPDARMIDAKKRCMDPLTAGCGRVSSFSAHYRQQLADFLATDFHYPVTADTEE